MGILQTLESALISRSALAGALGRMFGGKRDFYEALGYVNSIDIKQYRQRYKRNSIAGRAVDAFPSATWRGTGGELVENEDPETITPFEAAWMTFADRLHVWSILKRADILAGLGRFSVVLIGAPGELQTPLTKISIDRISFLTTYSEEDVNIKTWENDVNNPRFGFPLLYTFKRLTGETREIARDVHWSRVIHIADGLLDDNVYGQPRLERIWNDLDNLEKVVGGGSEAFWLRANQGQIFNIDKDLKPSPEEKEDMKEQVDEFVHGMRRMLRTRGMEVSTLGSDVADFANPADCILGLISAGTSIPKRILLGSERGELASTQDRENWTERVQDRRDDFAGPLVVRQLVNRLIEFGALPKPESYEVFWPAVNDLTDEQKLDVAIKYAEVNAKAGEVVVTANEIRDLAFGMEPLDPEELEEEDSEEIDEDEDEDLQIAKVKPAKWMRMRKHLVMLYQHPKSRASKFLLRKVA
jgi:hypothetical protein